MNFRYIMTLVLAFLLSSLTSTYGQVKTFTAQEMHQDLDYLNKYLRKWHPTYYLYTKKEIMNQYYEGLKTSIDTSKTLGQFRLDVMKAVDQVHCGHMSVDVGKYGGGVDSLPFLPMDLYILDNKMYVRKYFHNDSLLRCGDQLLTIDGVSIDSLIQNVSQLKAGDAFNFTHKEYVLDQLYYVYHYIYYGKRDSFQITKMDQNGVTISNHVKAKHRKTNLFPFYQPHPIDSSKIIIKSKSLNLQTTDIDPDTYVIDYNSFSGRGQRSAHRKIFKYLKKRHAKNLIIDLRGNGGGNVFAGHNFMKYLLKKDIFLFDMSRKPNLTFINPKMKGSFWSKITPLLFMTNPLQYPSKRGWHHVFPFLRKYRYHYDGKVYVMTDGMTFSMSTIVATKLKNEINATIVGAETGGSSNSSRGMAQGIIELPNSKLRVKFNLYQIKYAKGEDDNRGLMPNYPINYIIEDKMNKSDLELLKISELINKSK